MPQALQGRGSCRQGHATLRHVSRKLVLLLGVTLHAEQRMYCTFFGVVTSVTGALRKFEDTAEKNPISAM